jgi:hypothetical protein
MAAAWPARGTGAVHALSRRRDRRLHRGLGFGIDHYLVSFGSK